MARKILSLSTDGRRVSEGGVAVQKRIALYFPEARRLTGAELLLKVT